MTNTVRAIPIVQPHNNRGHPERERLCRSDVVSSIIRSSPRTATKSRSSSGVGDIILTYLRTE
ncbi:hypothetical protein LORF8 [Gallid alphaherpesvirus 3]|uniref:Uncharacterized protein LORF8 n=1 Tax=Gallid alphaherpesvirus 3 TaxID=35250 RepID=F8TC42_9ALPH|nr:hypothetical protein LORF8 [Gallid alphaherpesvirus 3]AEI00253.1 hypothetical protein LORF8 [Gallid alphaherpesvirus 3]QEY02331.1 hypothetical protein [Gallid alphaherpesvirus 3]